MQVHRLITIHMMNINDAKTNHTEIEINWKNHIVSNKNNDDITP